MASSVRVAFTRNVICATGYGIFIIPVRYSRQIIFRVLADAVSARSEAAAVFRLLCVVYWLFTVSLCAGLYSLAGVIHNASAVPSTLWFCFDGLVDFTLAVINTRCIP